MFSLKNMANRTDPLARDVHGTNPQFLLGKIARSKIYDSQYWKEHCFGLTGEDCCQSIILCRALSYIYDSCLFVSQPKQ